LLKVIRMTSNPCGFVGEQQKYARRAPKRHLPMSFPAQEPQRRANCAHRESILRNFQPLDESEILDYRLRLRPLVHQSKITNPKSKIAIMARDAYSGD
jgi:hypothetical protein